ncbi:MAG: uroporphyrinogen decarboxylase family protein [Chloroflexota bacterium]
MNSRERIRTIMAGGTPDRCGFWLGNPHADTWPLLHAYFGTATEEELRRKLGDDLRWIRPSRYAQPGREKLFEIPGKLAHGTRGPFADATTLADLEAYDWPRLDCLDWTDTVAALDKAGDVYRASGFWTSFYHNVMDLFGMEAYMMNMYLQPELVLAVTDRVCQFYYDANERFFAEAGDRVDAYFYGNDFGTQLDLICGPTQFDRFVLPWFRRFAAQGHRWGHQVVLHSCGSIHKVIERLIAAGVNGLHPLQALAAHMDAETLARDFKGRIAFMGGIDTQELLIHATPEAVWQEVRRVKALLGPNLIVSPSHEAILPNVPPRNIAAMAEAALE